jgi:transcriptional regulator with XRE-family HTH domain
MAAEPQRCHQKGHPTNETPFSPNLLTPATLRAARALLDWSRDDLAEKSDTSAYTIKGFEARGTDPKMETVQKWRRALEAAGVEFQDETETECSGVRLKKQAKRR